MSENRITIICRGRAGAPKGNKNALKHGRYSAKAKALRKRIRDWRARTRVLLAAVEAELGEPLSPSP